MVCISDGPLRILLVEDHVDTVRALSRLLGSVGYYVRAAGSIREAMDLTQTESFDLLISDIALPDGSGLDLMRRLSAVGPTKGIAVSGYGDESYVSHSREAGFAAHLTKPTDLPCLLAAIQQVTGSQC